MKLFAIYWIVGCLIVGASLGLYEIRCPKDPAFEVATVIAGIATWPAGFTWAMANSKPSACKVANE